MTINRELDALVAEHVMGWTEEQTFDKGSECYWAFRDDEGRLRYIDTKHSFKFPWTMFNPSTRIADAWLVVKKMKEFGWSCEMWHHNSDDNFCAFWELYSIRSAAAVNHQPSMPEAICKAALEAVGYDYK